MNRPSNEVVRVLANVIGMLLAGFILALMVAQCRETRETHDAVIELKARQDKK